MKKSFTTYFSLFLLAICGFGVWIKPATAQTSSVNDYRGLYMILDPRVTANGDAPMYNYYETALANPNIDGVTMIMLWTSLYNTVDAKPQNYNWTQLDFWANEAIKHNKKISLGVIAGMWTPQWLLEPPFNVPAHYFTFNSGPLIKANCVTRLLPTIWDATYVYRYNQMTTDLAAHLKSTGAFGHVSIVKLEGLNEETQELNIGATRIPDFNCPLSANSQYLSEGWIANGFAPDKVHGQWQMITENTAANFPTQELSVDILSNYQAFPSGNNQYIVIAEPTGGTDATTDYLLQTTILPGPNQRSYHNRFSVQWDALSTGSLDAEVFKAKGYGANIAWQVNDGYGTAGAACPVNGVNQPCTATSYQAMLDHGLILGGQFIEVSAIDVVEFPSAFAEAHQRLFGVGQ